MRRTAFASGWATAEAGQRVRHARVETTGFHNRLDGGDSSAFAHHPDDAPGDRGGPWLVERFRLVDTNRIDYQFTVEDPKPCVRTRWHSDDSA